MFRDLFFDGLKQNSAWVLEDDNGNEYTVFKDLTVVAPDKTYKCNSIDEVMSIPTTSSDQTVGDLIDHLRSLDFNHVSQNTHPTSRSIQG